MIPHGGPNISKPSYSGLWRMALSMDSTMNKTSPATSSSARSRPMKACRKPMMMIPSRAKKMTDSFIITFSTTSMAPKKRKLSRYSSRRDQNIGARKANML